LPSLRNFPVLGDFYSPPTEEGRFMRRSSRPWTENDLVKLKRMARKYPTARIAAELGRSIGGIILKAHELKLSLLMSRPNSGAEAQLSMDPGAAGVNLSDSDSIANTLRPSDVSSPEWKRTT
jgi:hypothetical protein